MTLESAGSRMTKHGIQDEVSMVEVLGQPCLAGTTAARVAANREAKTG